MNQPNPVQLPTDFSPYLSTKLSTGKAFINTLFLLIKVLMDATVKTYKWMGVGVTGRLNQAFYLAKLFFNSRFRIRLEKADQEIAIANHRFSPWVDGLIHNPCQHVVNQYAMFHVELA